MSTIRQGDSANQCFVTIQPFSLNLYRCETMNLIGLLAWNLGVLIPNVAFFLYICIAFCCLVHDLRSELFFSVLQLSAVTTCKKKIDWFLSKKLTYVLQHFQIRKSNDYGFPMFCRNRSREVSRSTTVSTLSDYVLRKVHTSHESNRQKGIQRANCGRIGNLAEVINVETDDDHFITNCSISFKEAS